MGWAEWPISVNSGQWQGWWICGIGPIVAMLQAILACSFPAKRVEVATLDYLESDHDRLFRRVATGRGERAA
jgi:hypothetical protein